MPISWYNYKLEYRGISMGFLDKLLNRETNEMPKTSVDEEDCCFDAVVVENRIKKVLEENWSGCELRKHVPADAIGADAIEWTYTYGVYREGQAVVMINILDNKNDYKRKIVLQSKEACMDQGIGYIHFLLHLPNRASYILECLSEEMPA
ncbi:MAG: hypothetical protein K2G39_01565 [Lachnospiraceae bacterium]|nr:hypothetical protein [Lachnospiraceae bacterium]